MTITKGKRREIAWACALRQKPAPRCALWRVTALQVEMTKTAGSAGLGGVWRRFGLSVGHETGKKMSKGSKKQANMTSPRRFKKRHKSIPAMLDSLYGNLLGRT